MRVEVRYGDNDISVEDAGEVEVVHNYGLNSEFAITARDYPVEQDLSEEDLHNIYLATI